jgi:hypothetical protein
LLGNEKERERSDFDKFFSGDDFVEDKPREHADQNSSPDGRRSSNFIGENIKMKIETIINKNKLFI